MGKNKYLKTSPIDIVDTNAVVARVAQARYPGGNHLHSRHKQPHHAENPPTLHIHRYKYYFLLTVYENHDSHQIFITYLYHSIYD